MSCLWVKLPSWQCRWIVAMSLSPSASVIFGHDDHNIPPPLSPLPVSRLTRLKKVPMMHGASTSTVSSTTTPITNVPFAESAASNQVCPLILASPLILAVGPQTWVHRERTLLNWLWCQEFQCCILKHNHLFTSSASFFTCVCVLNYCQVSTLLFLLPLLLNLQDLSTAAQIFPWELDSHESRLGEWCNFALENSQSPDGLELSMDHRWACSSAQRSPQCYLLCVAACSLTLTLLSLRSQGSVGSQVWGCRGNHTVCLYPHNSCYRIWSLFLLPSLLFCCAPLPSFLFPACSPVVCRVWS